MTFRRRANDGPLLWFLDPLSPRQLKWHWIFLCQSQNFLDPCLQRERERVREREQLINGITNEQANIGKDKRKDENYTPLGINAGGITNVDLDIKFRIFKDRMCLVTRNSPLVHWNNKCPDQPAHLQSYRNLCF